ncbi:MAG: hypothetical protein ACXVKA_09335 [Acidimicrobiia bacterium]
MDTTVTPPPGVLDAAVRPCSLPSLGSVLVEACCPECGRDLSEPVPEPHLVLCETCLGE